MNHWMNVDNAYILCKPNLYQNRERVHYPRKFPHTPSSLILALTALLSSPAIIVLGICYRLVLPNLEFQINGIIQHIVFCVRLLSLSVMFLRFIHVVACLLLFITE